MIPSADSSFADKLDKLTDLNREIAGCLDESEVLHRSLKLETEIVNAGTGEVLEGEKPVRRPLPGASCRPMPGTKVNRATSDRDIERERRDRDRRDRRRQRPSTGVGGTAGGSPGGAGTNAAGAGR